ncbi:MAG: hypothetical protein AB7H93_23675 [Vicinamibacterales bacterium]
MFALLLSALGAAKTAVDLVDAGKAAIEAVTGAPPASPVTDHGSLAAAVEALPEAQREAVAAAMATDLQRYVAETARLAHEQGEVTAGVLAVLPPAIAGKVAVLRMTTRPWLVRLLARGMVWPPLGVLAIDGVLVLANNLAAAFAERAVLPATATAGAVLAQALPPWRVELLSATLLADGAGFVTLYSWYAPTAASVIAAYIGAREAGKWQRGEDNVVTRLGAAVDAARGLFGRAKALVR